VKYLVKYKIYECDSVTNRIVFEVMSEAGLVPTNDNDLNVRYGVILSCIRIRLYFYDTPY
jgi:hypothetical protein